MKQYYDDDDDTIICKRFARVFCNKARAHILISVFLFFSGDFFCCVRCRRDFQDELIKNDERMKIIS